MPGSLTLDDLQAEADAGIVDTVVVATTEATGTLAGRAFHVDAFLEAAHRGEPRGDIVVLPDLTTLRTIPWREGTALVLADVLDRHGEAVPHAPRNVLKRQLDRLAAAGLRVECASELEFYLFAEGFDALAGKRYRDARPLTVGEEPIMRAIRNGLHDANIPVESSAHASGPGQFSIRLRRAGALEMADGHAILRGGIRDIAHAHGTAATFMARWCDDVPGSSCQLHQTLCEAGEEAVRRYGAGQAAYAAEIAYFLGPFVNSYKCSPFAGGADLNPYLGYAATIAAGLAGAGGSPREAPGTLREATECLRGSAMLRAAFGDTVVDHYVGVAAEEQARHDRVVTDWELVRGFDRG
jgi:glutamine synthetase